MYLIVHTQNLYLDGHGIVIRLFNTYSQTYWIVWQQQYSTMSLWIYYIGRLPDLHFLQFLFWRTLYFSHVFIFSILLSSQNFVYHLTTHYQLHIYPVHEYPPIGETIFSRNFFLSESKQAFYLGTMCLTKQPFLTKDTKVRVTANLLCNVITHAKHNIELPTKWLLCTIHYN